MGVVPRPLKGNYPLIMAANQSTSRRSSSDKKMRKESISTALTSDLIESGKELLTAGEIPAAVEELSEACEFLSKEFGEAAEECAEAYLYYGKALLELGKLENKVLGNALEGFDVSGEGSTRRESSSVEDVEGMTRDEQEEVEENVAAALEENFEKIDQIAKMHTGAESEDDDEDDSTDGEETEDEELGDGVQGSTKDESSKGVEEAEETSNLQAAWEVLEVAKLAFGKTVSRTQGERRIQAEEKLCSTMLALAEVSIENENYAIAVDDLKNCLNKGKTVLPSNARFVAEVQYQLGLALGHLNRLPEAEAAVGEAISVLHSKKEGLLKESPSEARDKELAELETLIADIGEAKKGLPDLVDGSSHGAAGTEGFTKAIDGKAASTIGIKRAAEENFVELAKKGRVEGPAMA